MFKIARFALILGLTLLLGLSAFAAEKTIIEKTEEYEIAQLGQAPELAEKVEDGELSPVEDRVPVKEDLYVVEPNESIGKYGGTIRTTSITPTGYGDDNNLMIFTSPLQALPDGSGVRPQVAKKVTSSADKTTWTMYLRRGMKWSDGHPFTADDVMFWYNDYLLNENLTPVVGSAWKVNGEVMEVTKLDDYTVEFKFVAPRPFFQNRLTQAGAWDLFMPKHYLKQFHPAYEDAEKLKKMAKDAGFDHWYQLFNDKNTQVWGQSINPDRPTLASFRCVKRTSDRRIYERNPYYWKVDTEGNQLPYIDRIETQIVSDKEVVQGMIMSGEVDFAGMMAEIRNFPMYKKFESQGGFRTVLWETGMGSDVIYMFNLTHPDPQMREIFQDLRFRKAMSIGINRQEINDTIYFGKATPRQFTNLESSQYFEPEFAKSYIEYDPDRAKELLDEVGLVDQNGDGWRDLPSGDPFNFTVEFYVMETPKRPNVELVTQHWRELGINCSSKSISGELANQRAPGNLMDATLWHGDKATDILFPIQPQFRVPHAPGWERTIWPAWSTWYNTDGESGEEPPDTEVGREADKQHERWVQIMKEPNREKRIELGKAILESQAENLWSIGTVGKSPYPIVLSADLRNFPESGFWVWDTKWACSRDPSQLYYENPDQH